MQRTVSLPVVPQPGWELENEDEEEQPELRNSAESFVILQSLRQSRDKWLSSTFPKFSSKTRGGKPSDVVPPPHSVKAAKAFDLVVGPHTFANTVLYQVRYLPPALPAWTLPSNSAALSHIGGALLHTPETLVSGPSAAQLNIPAESASAITSLAPDGVVTPEIVKYVHTIAASDPTLQNLLHQCWAGKATTDQTKTLGLLLQTLGRPQPNAGISGAPIQTPQPFSTAPKDFDIILQFQEKPSDRWLLPRGPVVCERVLLDGGSTNICDILLTVVLPFTEPGVRNQTISEPEVTPTSPQVVSFRLCKVDTWVWDLFMSWSGGEQGMQESKKHVEEILQQMPSRTFLQHQLPDGPLLNQIKAAAAPPYTTRLIKPGAEGSRTKRKLGPRKPPVGQASSQTDSINKLPPAKRRRQSTAKPVQAPALISCHACGQTDVPLMMGGRFCRSCIDAGRSTVDIPQLPTRSGSFTHSRSTQLPLQEQVSPPSELPQPGNDGEIISRPPQLTAHSPLAVQAPVVASSLLPDTNPEIQ